MSLISFFYCLLLCLILRMNQVLLLLDILAGPCSLPFQPDSSTMRVSRVGPGSRLYTSKVSVNCFPTSEACGTCRYLSQPEAVCSGRRPDSGGLCSLVHMMKGLCGVHGFSRSCFPRISGGKSPKQDCSCELQVLCKDPHTITVESDIVIAKAPWIRPLKKKGKSAFELGFVGCSALEQSSG